MRGQATIVLRDVVPNSAIFTTAEAATRAGATRDSMSRTLARLATAGLLTHLTRGLWADEHHPDFSPYAVIPYLLTVEGYSRSDGSIATGYVSFVSALHLHGVISQIPAAIHIAAAKQRADVMTPVARFRFHQLATDLLGGHGPGDSYDRFRLATPVKALFDTIYLSARRGRQFHSLPELDLPSTLRDSEMRRWIAKIRHRPLRNAVAERWNLLMVRHSHTDS